MKTLSPTWLLLAIAIALACCAHDGGKRSVFQEIKVAVERTQRVQAGISDEAKTK